LPAIASFDGGACVIHPGWVGYGRWGSFSLLRLHYGLLVIRLLAKHTIRPSGVNPDDWLHLHQILQGISHN